MPQRRWWQWRRRRCQARFGIRRRARRQRIRGSGCRWGGRWEHRGIERGKRSPTKATVGGSRLGPLFPAARRHSREWLTNSFADLTLGFTFCDMHRHVIVCYAAPTTFVFVRFLGRYRVGTHIPVALVAPSNEDDCDTIANYLTTVGTLAKAGGADGGGGGDGGAAVGSCAGTDVGGGLALCRRRRSGVSQVYSSGAGDCGTSRVASDDSERPRTCPLPPHCARLSTDTPTFAPVSP